MTNRLESNRPFLKRRASTLWIALISLGMICTIFILALCYSEEMAKYVREGILLAVRQVLPTAFPFMIISAFLLSAVDPRSFSFIGGAFSAIFCMPASAITPLLVGNVCGFPIGASLSIKLYQSGAITHRQCQRLLAYSNNPSPAFVIGVVGNNILGSASLGVTLLLSIYISTCISAQIYREKFNETGAYKEIAPPKFDFPASVRDAGLASITLISFIALFSLAVGILKDLGRVFPFLECLIPFLEVTSACNYFAARVTGGNPFLLPIVAFSLGFGGLSVAAQISSFRTGTDIKMRDYFLIKLVTGLLSALIILAYLFIAQK